MYPVPRRYNIFHETSKEMFVCIPKHRLSAMVLTIIHNVFCIANQETYASVIHHSSSSYIKFKFPLNLIYKINVFFLSYLKHHHVKHLYMQIKLRFTLVCITFLILPQNMDCGYSLEQSRRDLFLEQKHRKYYLLSLINVISRSKKNCNKL